MNTVKNTKKIVKSTRNSLASFDEAKLFSTPIEIKGNHLIIKLPKKTLKYLNLEKASSVNVIPINNTLQIVGGKALTFIPSIDLENLESQFISQV